MNSGETVFELFGNADTHLNLFLVIEDWLAKDLYNDIDEQIILFEIEILIRVSRYAIF